MSQALDAMMSTGPHDRIASNIERSAHAQERSAQAAEVSARANLVTMQRIGQLVEISADLLDVTEDVRDIGLAQLDVSQQALFVSAQIRELNASSLQVNQEQLLQAMRTVRKLDLGNQRLAQIDASLADVSALLVKQNALIQKSLNRLGAEAEELVNRGMEAFAHGWLEDAANDFQTALTKNPYSAVAHYYLGKCHTVTGQEAAARQSYQKCAHYARKNAPVFESLAHCDLAISALSQGAVAEARRHASLAAGCPETDRTVLVRTLLRCDAAEGALTPGTQAAIRRGFADEAVDPEVLLQVLSREDMGAKDSPLARQVLAERPKWEAAAREALFNRTISDYYRELDDFVYLAPRIRRGFMEADGGRFLSLGAPLADILDWSAAIGERLLRDIGRFTSEHLPVLALHRTLAGWKGLLVDLGKLLSLLGAKAGLFDGVVKVNLGLLNLPVRYEDDRILFEVNTAEGDILALSCYYAIFVRNGVEQFAIPLKDFAVLRIDTYPAANAKGVLIQDPRTGQVLLQGLTPAGWQDEAGELVYPIDLFVEAAGVLCRLHELLGWAIGHENELFSIFLLLHAVSERLAGRSAIAPKTAAEIVDDGFETVDDDPPVAKFPVVADDDFELVV